MIRSLLLGEGHSLAPNLSRFLFQGEEFTWFFGERGKAQKEMIFERLRETVSLRMLLRDLVANRRTH